MEASSSSAEGHQQGPRKMSLGDSWSESGSEEILPPYCQFDKLDRAGAEKLLRKKNKDGMYLIREGIEGMKALSVWLRGSCYHYMIHSDGQGSFFLAKSQPFDSLQELLRYYTFQTHLPRLGHCLHKPYQPKESNIPALVRSYGMHTVHGPPLRVSHSGVPRLRIGSAPELLDDKCRYSGWIRKQGGGHKSWKRRYLILRAGCLYYFSSETASTPKGMFVLTGYDVITCSEVKKFPHMLKLEPMNPCARTYLIACNTHSELERWKFELEKEISQLSFLRPSISSTSSSPDATSIQPPPLTWTDHTTPPPSKTDPTLMYNDVDYDSSESDSSMQITESAEYPKPQTSIDLEDQLTTNARFTDELPALSTHSSTSSTEEYTDASSVPINHYLTLIRDQGSSTGAGHVNGEPKPFHQRQSPVLLEPELNPLPQRQSPVLLEPELNPLPQRQSPVLVEPDSNSLHQRQSPLLVELESNQRQSPMLMKSEPSQVCSSPEDDEYYIMFPTAEETLPPSCLFRALDRAEAERLLQSNNEEGMYLIREGSAKSGSEKVLSVWHNEHCRHYKLFIQNESYMLTRGEQFSSLPALIQFYRFQSFLPLSDFYLKTPYKANYS